MADILAADWIEEFESLTESEIHTYSAEQEHNHEIMIALYNILSEPYKYNPELLDSICRQFLDFYRSGEKQLRKFTMQYIPSLVFLHLIDKSYTSVQALLVSLYNLEVVDNKGQPRSISFRIPSLAQSSIFHDSSTLDPAFMAENSLRRYEECNTKLVSWGPVPQVEYLNAQNRQQVITALVFLYNQQLANVIVQGIEHTCKEIANLVTQGLPTYAGSNRNSLNCESDLVSWNNRGRIAVSSNLLIELLHTIYHAAERGVSGSMQTLECVIQRATYETYADVTLVATSIRNLIQKSSSASITPRPSQHTVSKSMITNASFRTKKLPDDIPILDEQTASEAPLDSITEEQEEVEKKSKGSVSALKHLPKLSGLTKRHKAKNVPQGDQPSVELSMSTDQVNESHVNESNHTVHVSAV